MDDRDGRLEELEQQVSALQRQLTGQPRGRRWPLGRYAVATLVGLAVIASTAVALVSAHNGDASLVHSCVSTSTGAIRITNPSTSSTGAGMDRACSAQEQPRDWPLAGASGPLRLSGQEGITVDPPCVNNTVCSSTASCSAGKVLNGGGGGVAFVAGAGLPVVSYSGPETGSTASWLVFVQSANGLAFTSMTARAVAYCAFP